MTPNIQKYLSLILQNSDQYWLSIKLWMPQKLNHGYRIYPAIRQGFCPSRMTSNNLVSAMKFCYNTNIPLPKQSQRSRSILQDGSRSFVLFWKENTLSYNRRNTISKNQNEYRVSKMDFIIMIISNCDIQHVQKLNFEYPKIIFVIFNINL